MQELTVPYPPQLNHCKAVVRGRLVTSAIARQYRQEVGWLAKSKRLLLMAGPLSLTFKFFRPRKAGDLDSLLKVLIDSLTGIVYTDDSQIVEIHAYRYDDKAAPRAEIIIAEVK